MSTSPLTVRISKDIFERLDRLAKATKRSKSFLAAEAIEEYLSIQEWQVQAIHDGIKAADSGETVDFESVKRSWEKKLADSSD